MSGIEKERAPVVDYGSDEYAEAVAIVGIAGRWPGAESVAEFWENLRQGVESVSFFSEEEVEGVTPETAADPAYVKAKGIIRDPEWFDAGFFDVAPQEAAVMDPQHRVFLECAWSALEDAGYDASRYDGRVGVFGGMSINTYMLMNLALNPDAVRAAGQFQALIGNANDHLTTRVAYKLDLRGPAVTVQTACSTSLVAVHMACQSLLSGESDMALAGGVAVTFPLRTGYLYQEGMIFSPDGHCRAFDAEARGTVNGNGAGVVVLKRLADALDDGDHVYAIVRGSAVNNDGASKVGYTAPSVASQAAVVTEALSMAGVPPETISYVEAHGSGTPMGDPIEVAALTRAYRTRTPERGFCALGSVKTNIGHLDAAAGVSGLVRATLALRHRQIPPTLHFREPNPRIDFDGSPFYVGAELADWPAGAAPRRAGVNSLGVGGTNAHAVLEEAPAPAPGGPSRPRQLLVLSAKTTTALEAATDRLATHLEAHPEQALADLAYTLQVGRREFRHRRVLMAGDREDAVRELRERGPQRLLTGDAGAGEGSGRPVVFMFPGLGEQYSGMARGLYAAEPAFAEEVDRCAELLRPHLGVDLRELLFPPEGAAAPSGGAIDFRRMVGRGGSAADALDRTLYAHPAVFVVEYALARLWMSWGVRPEAMIGYSVGEYVAAALSGVLSLEDALMLVAGRARLVDGLPAGALLAVPLSEDELAPHLGEGVSLMAVNGPALCVAAGDEAAVAALEEALRARGVVSRRLRAGHAFHSRMMEPAAAPFRELLRGVALGAPGIPYVSTVTGGWIRPEEAADPELWVRHLVRPVRFSEGLGTLAEEPSRAYLEVGPGRTLGSFAAQLAGSPGRVVAPSLRAAYETADDPDLLLGSLGRLWLAGVPVDWRAFHAGEERRRVPAPTYPFERERFLVGPGARPGARAAAPRPPAKGRDMAEWFYQPVWRQARVPVAHLPGPVADPDGEDAPWLLLADGGRIGELLAERLREGGRRVLTVRPGAESGAAGEDAYTLQPDEPRGYLDLLRALRARGAFPRRIVHLWGAEPAGTGGGLEGFEREQERVLHPLLYLAQALGREALSESVRLWVVTAGAQAVESRDVPHPGRATVLAPCRVIGQEYPNVTCRAVDLAEDALEGPAAERAVGQLLTEVSHPLPDLETAYRGAQRWVRAFEPLRLEASAGALPIRLRRGGVYLITGGLGRIGLALAAHLARTADAKLALLGRTGVPPRDEWDGLLAAGDGDETVRERVRALRALESAGAEVLVLRGDAGSEADVREAVRAVRERFGALHGVVHAAGVAQGGMLRLLPETDVAELRRQFHPKVGGTYALHAALGDDPLDFCLLTSSLSPILGGLGFTAYASANLFLDAFAQSRHAAGDTRWTSINWADWESGEESGDAAAGIGATVAEFEMSTGEGVGTFERILSTSASLPQVVVSRGDLHQRLNQWLARERPADAAPADAAGEAAGHGRPELNNPYVAPRDETEERICAVWSEVLGVRPVGVYDNFFELGGHSLSGIQIVSRLREAFQVDLPLTALLTSPVVAEVALVIEELAIERVLSMSEDELRQLQ